MKCRLISNLVPERITEQHFLILCCRWCFLRNKNDMMELFLLRYLCEHEVVAGFKFSLEIESLRGKKCFSARKFEFHDFFRRFFRFFPVFCRTSHPKKNKSSFRLCQHSHIVFWQVISWIDLLLLLYRSGTMDVDASTKIFDFFISQYQIRLKADAGRGNDSIFTRLLCRAEWNKNISLFKGKNVKFWCYQHVWSMFNPNSSAIKVLRLRSAPWLDRGRVHTYEYPWNSAQWIINFSILLSANKASICSNKTLFFSSRIKYLYAAWCLTFMLERWEQELGSAIKEVIKLNSSHWRGRLYYVFVIFLPF